MTVAFDAYLSNLAGGYPAVFNFAPVGIPRGITVAVASTFVPAGVTYGGEPMSLFASRAGAGELAGITIYGYILGSGVPAGTQQIVMQGLSDTQGIAFVRSYTAADDCEIVASGSLSDVLADPGILLSLAGRVCAAAIALGSGFDTVSGIGVTGPDWTSHTDSEHDGGPVVFASYTYNPIDDVDVLAEWNQDVEDAVAIAWAISEVVASGAITGSGGATITLGNTGTASVQVRGSGAAAIATAASGAATVQVRASGAGAIALSQSGAAALQVRSTGTAAITIGSAGAAIVRVAGAGASTITLAQAGAAALQVRGSGQAAIALGQSGTAAIGDVPVSAAGTSSISLASSGAATLRIAAAGGSAIVTGASGAAGVVVRAGGGSAFLTSAIGVGRVQIRGAGASALMLAQGGAAGIDLGVAQALPENQVHSAGNVRTGASAANVRSVLSAPNTRTARVR